MKVSICIPTHNRSELLRECLDSIMAQTHKDIEIVVSSNASTDDTNNIVKDYKDVNFFEHKIALNWYENWNFVKKHAKGDLVALFHDDDIYESTIIEEVVNLFKKRDKLLLVHTASFQFTHGNFENRLLREQKAHPLFMDAEKYLEYCSNNWCSINCPTVFVKSDMYKKYDFKPAYLSADYFMWFSVLQNNGEIGYINKPLMNYRQHDSVKKNIDNMLAIYQYKEMFLKSLRGNNQKNKNMYEINLNKTIHSRILQEYRLKDCLKVNQVIFFLDKINSYGFKINIFNFYCKIILRLVLSLVKKIIKRI